MQEISGKKKSRKQEPEGRQSSHPKEGRVSSLASYAKDRSGRNPKEGRVSSLASYAKDRPGRNPKEGRVSSLSSLAKGGQGNISASFTEGRQGFEDILRSEIQKSLYELFHERLPGDRESVLFSTKGPSALGIRIPASIFSDHELGVLEALVKYLREQGYSLKEISLLLGKDNKSLWSSYRNAQAKHKQRLELSGPSLPLSVFSKKGLSCFESAALILKDEYGLSFGKISGYLGRNYQTVWTTYSRAKKKSGRLAKEGRRDSHGHDGRDRKVTSGRKDGR